MYKAIEIARYIIDKCEKDSKPISNLQLQKILFFIQKEYLQNQGIPAFSDDIEAWKFGPVVSDVYYQFSGYGASPITLTYNDPGIEDTDQQIVNPIIESRRGLYPWDLVNETHKTGGAWYTVFKNGEGNKQIIPKQLIKELG